MRCDTTDIATGDSLFKISFYKKSCGQILTFDIKLVVLMLNANQLQNLILITWSNMSALQPKMGNPPPYQGIPCTPSSSIFVYKNSQRKLWNYPINHAKKTTAFLPRDHNEGYITTYLPDYFHPWKKLQIVAPFRSRHFAKQDFTQALVGQLCMCGDLPRVQLSIFAIIVICIGVSQTTLFR